MGQTEGEWGHSFWGKISIGAVAVASTLDQVAEAAEYIPEPGPKPAESADMARMNNVVDLINKAGGLDLPKADPARGIDKFDFNAELRKYNEGGE